MVYKYCLRGSRVGSRVRLDLGCWKTPDDDWFIIANSVCSQEQYNRYKSRKFIPVFFDQITDWYGIYNRVTRGDAQITAGIMKRTGNYWEGVLTDV